MIPLYTIQTRHGSPPDPGLTPSRLTRQLGNSRVHVRRVTEAEFADLVRAAIAPPIERTRWTKNDDEALLGAETAAARRKLAEALGRSVAAVTRRRRRLLEPAAKGT